MYRIAVTNRHLCEGDFLERIRQIAQGDEYNAILLREKDLSHEEYEELAKKVLKITNLAGKNVFCIGITRRHFLFSSFCAYAAFGYGTDVSKGKGKS